jgi:hypothetical protein
MEASKVFVQRFRTVSSQQQEMLDKLQQQYGAAGAEMLNSWEALTVKHSEWLGMPCPSDEASLGAFRRELEASAAKRRKAREIAPVVTAKTSMNFATPPPQKKRQNDISPPVEAKRQLTVDLLSSVTPYKAPLYQPASSQPASAPIPEVEAANDWTARWMKASGADRMLYMDAPLDTIADKLRNEIVAFGEEALTAHRIRFPAFRGAEAADKASEEAAEFATNFDKVGACLQARNVLLCGRIVCEAESGKINLKSLMLEGTNGIRVKLDTDGLKDVKVSLFPGQFVIVEGISFGSNRVRAERIYTGASQPTPAREDGKDFTMWVASGPYTASTDLKFEYLDAMLAEVKRENPEFLMLLGPFVDANHPLIVTGRPSLQLVDASGTAHTMTDLGFEDVFGFFLQRILTGLKDARTKVILVPCTDDVIHPIAAFPQPSVKIDDDLNDPRFISLPNPATVKIGGVTFGLAHIDTLFDFQEEGAPAVGFEARENMPRLLSHMLMQRSYYPIVPPSADSLVDVSAREHFSLPAVDVLLTPSRLQAFAYDVDGVLCVNPGRSNTMKTKMTIAKMEFTGAGGGAANSNVAKARSKVEFLTVG